MCGLAAGGRREILAGSTSSMLKYTVIFSTVTDKIVNTLQNLPSNPPAKDALEAARNGFNFYKHLQSPDGHWPGEYGGPMFLMPGLAIGSYVTGMDFKREERLEMIRYLLNRAHPEDGGCGL